ncbi:recombinase family protein [Streptomyces sp. ISL-22]|uniref:recombinase family protein n=1 Tax=unclassified Streptomyces TaxID=2593676 RepID=UPI001BE62409|nr:MULTISPECIES: recombinase family protein [unclassified Streptomyces]MBT2423385.1 recombinase family protein [Streptomyces sp. ISL-24]MBT2437940.1 recombinase family protein [Streptomyces sp. ISL-22]
MTTALIRPDLPSSVALAQLTASYGRVSLDELKLGQGVASQHNENDDFGEEIGHPVSARYEDVGISAFDQRKERPGFQALLRDIRLGLIAIVIVWHADGLTRDVGEGREFIALCRKYGVKLFSQQRGGEYNFNRAAGRADFLRDIVKAEEESGHKGERVALSHKRRAKNGEWGGGVRPFGWGVDTGRVRSYCVNPKADIADRVYEDRPVLDMTQHREDERDEIRHWKSELLAGVKVSVLIADINRRGVKTVSEKDGRKMIRNGRNILSYKWSRETVVGILTSPRVSGHAVWRGEIVARDVYDPIITEEERQALIELFSDPTRRTSPGNQPKWLGSLIFECGQCEGGVMRQRLKRPSDKMPLYLCNQCGKGRQPAPLLDAYIEATVIERLSRPDVAELMAPRQDVDFDGLREERTQLQERKDGLAVAFGRGSIDMAQLEAGTADIVKRLGEIQRRLIDAVGESPLTPFALDPGNAESLWAGLSLGRKREIIRTLMTVTILQAPQRRRGRRPADAPPEELDTSTVILAPKRLTGAQGAPQGAAQGGSAVPGPWRPAGAQEAPQAAA